MPEVRAWSAYPDAGELGGDHVVVPEFEAGLQAAEATVWAQAAREFPGDPPPPIHPRCAGTSR